MAGSDSVDEASGPWLLMSGYCAQREEVGGKGTNVDVRPNGRSSNMEGHVAVGWTCLLLAYRAKYILV